MPISKQFGARQGISQPTIVAGLKRTWRCGAALALGGALLAPALMGGCDKLESPTAQANRQVDQDVANSEAQRQSATEGAQKKAMDDLKSALAHADASNAEKARANSLLGQAEYRAASERMLQIERDQLKQQGVLWDIATIGAQVGQLSRTANSYKARDPKMVLDQLTKQEADTTQKQDQTNQKVTALNADLQKRQADIKQMESDKATADSQAEALGEKAAAAKGEEHLKLYTQEQDARQTSGTLAAKIAQAKAELLPIQQDIDLATTQVKMAADAIKSYQTQKQQLSGGWTELTTQITSQEDAAQKLVSDQIAAKAKEFKALVTTVDANRAETEKLLTSALDHFKAAATAGKAYCAQLDAMARNDKFTNAPEQSAWQDLKALYSEINFVFQKGLTEEAQGNLAASHQANLAAQQKLLTNLKAELDKAGAAWPADLGAAGPDAQITKATADGTAAYKAAQVSFEAVVSSGIKSSPELKKAAQGNGAMAAYGLYSLGDASELIKAQSLADTAGVTLPNKVPDFGSAPPLTPASAPATAPADGATAPAAPPQ